MLLLPLVYLGVLFLVVYVPHVGASCESEPDANGHVDLSYTTLTSIDNEAFQYCSQLKSIALPNTLKTIGKNSFAFSGLQEITIPDAVTIVNQYAFRECRDLVVVNFGDLLLTIGTSAFSNCSSIKSLMFPDSLVSVGESAFIYCTKLRSIAFGDSLQDIKVFAFAYAYALEMISFGRSDDLKLGLGAFVDATSLHVMKIGATNIAFNGGVLIGSLLDTDPKNSIYQISIETKEVKNIGVIVPFTCPGDGNTSCVCIPGYGNNESVSMSGFFSCIPCEKGHSNFPLSQNACSPCPSGTYANTRMAPSCTGCPVGTYSHVEGSVDLRNCTQCGLGKFSKQQGATECRECPPGNICGNGTVGVVNYVGCSLGRYADARGQTECSACPGGYYQNNIGQVQCKSCGIGKASTVVGAVSESVCNLCIPGRYASAVASIQCRQCADGWFQPNAGQNTCRDCTVVYDDKRLTHNSDHTACIANRALYAKSLAEVMFQGGLGLSLTFTVTLVFVLSAGFLHYLRLLEKGTLAKHKSALECCALAAHAGFQLASDIFIFTGMINHSNGIAVAILVLRSVHFFVSIFITLGIYSSKAVCQRMATYYPPILHFREGIDMEISIDNMSMVESVALLGMCDVTLLSLYPWKSDRDYLKHGGFPSLVLMDICLLTKAVQSMLTVLLEIVFLGAFVDSNEDEGDYAFLDGHTSELKTSISLSIIASMFYGLYALHTKYMSSGTKVDPLHKVRQGVMRAMSVLGVAATKEASGGGEGEVRTMNDVDLQVLENPGRTAGRVSVGITVADVFVNEPISSIWTENPLHATSVGTSSARSIELTGSITDDVLQSDASL